MMIIDSQIINKDLLMEVLKIKLLSGVQAITYNSTHFKYKHFLHTVLYFLEPKTIHQYNEPEVNKIQIQTT